MFRSKFFSQVIWCEVILPYFTYNVSCEHFVLGTECSDHDYDRKDYISTMNI